MKISLIERKLPSGKISLIIEYYKGSEISREGKRKHIRDRENLKLYLHNSPNNATERKENKAYINFITELLTSEMSIDKSDIIDQNILWSSGWTKVYSFINPNILIYDSRVSAFLNYTLIKNFDNLTDNQKVEFYKLSEQLFNFSGALGRERKVASFYGFKNQHPKGLNGFNANLISSWITQLTKEKLLIDQSIRTFERSFFMLGFDLNQIRD